MDYKARYEEWISNSYFDEDTRAELESIKEDENEIKERFYMDLEFGTALVLSRLMVAAASLLENGLMFSSASAGSYGTISSKWCSS